MRLTLAAAVLAALPCTAAAQSITSAPRAPALPPISAPLPPIALPLPQISYPLPPITLPPPGMVTPQIDHRPGHGPRQRLVLFPAYGWAYGYPGWMPYAESAPAPREERREEPLSGTLLLYVEPEDALQVFIDGYYAGTPEDFNSGLEIVAGAHTIELSAPGYESVTFKVKIDPSRPITYRGKLKPIEMKLGAEVASTPPPPSTLYYIPGCYLGNVDPKDVKLPEHCDLSKLVTRKAR
jgi:hypothetical protein